jgi:phage/plasmid-associated DNA primase
VPAFVPVIATNSPPTIRGADKALEKRLLIIPFDTQITEGKDQKQAAQNLSDSAKTAVLGWLAEGWVMYAKEGLPVSTWPGIVQERTKEFSHSLNDIGEFLADWTEEGPREGIIGEVYTPASKMYDAFVQWATVVQRIPDNQVYTATGFGKRMTEQGYKSKTKMMGRDKESGRSRTAKVYFGIKLKESGENMVSGKFKTRT